VELISVKRLCLWDVEKALKSRKNAPFRYQLFDMLQRMRSDGVPRCFNQPRIILTPKEQPKYEASYLYATMPDLNEVIGSLKHNEAISALELCHNKFGIDGIGVLAEELEKNESLMTFDFTRNNPGLDGLRLLSDAISINVTLTALNLEMNHIDAEGAQHIALALENNVSLTSVNLQFNDIRSDGAKHIAGALKKNERIAHLYLGSNNIDSAGVDSIIEALSTNTNSTLTDLDLSMNLIDDAGTEKLANALKTEQVPIKTIDLTGNRIGERGQDALKACLGKVELEIVFSVRKADDNAFQQCNIYRRDFQSLAKSISDQFKLKTLPKRIWALKAQHKILVEDDSMVEDLEEKTPLEFTI
jgi:hypothetical protein